MAAVVSHAMRRYPLSSQDTVYSSYSIRGEGSSWSNKEEGESALSRSMRYADPWLYGSMRGAPTRGGFVLAPAFVLCACPDYINGTKRSNKKGPSTCKKCKGTRVPLSSSDNTKFDTVRCYPTKMAGAHQTANTTSVRAGTMRVTSSSRPSILPATADPYDLMRRSRLSTEAGSQYNRGRALSPAKGKSGESRSHSATRNKGTNNAAEIFTSPTSSSAAGRRSILECNINPYELMSTEAELKPKDASITFLNGQRIRVRPPTYDPDYEDVIEQTQDGTSTKPLATKSPPNRRKSNTDSTSPKSNEKESECINRFKSILKKRTTFSDTDSVRSPEPCPSPASFRDKSGSSSSHFYIPMPGTPRKKVQFLVENELACQDASGGGEDVVPDYEDVEYFEMEEIEQQPTIDVTSIKVPDVVNKKVCRLRRTTSERFKHEPRKVVFLDTMALRTKSPRNDSREAFGGHDLQKLDGLVSRSRKISLSKIKPDDPSPHLPISDFLPIENGIKREIPPNKTDINEEDVPIEDVTVMNDDVFIPEQANLTVEDADYQEVGFQELKEIAKFIFFGDATVSPSISPLENIKNISPIVESIQVTAINDDVNLKLECLTKTVPEIGVTPPSAPPRKRSGNKQPLVNIILTSQTPEIGPIELPKSSDYQNRTVVQINSPTTPVHKLQIRNEFNDSSNIQTVSVSDCPQRKTSILISGDDCYSTVNVNDDIPLYQSSVVVKDVSVDVISIGNNRRSSSVYITGNFVTEDDPTTVEKPEKPNEVKTHEIQDPEVTKDEIEISCKPPEKCEDVYGAASSELLKEMLRDPVEAVKRNLVPHVCGKSDMSRRRRDNKFKHSYPMIALNESLLEPLLSTRNDPSNNDNARDTTLRLKSFNFETSNDDDKDMCSEHSSYTQYELIDMGSDCYTDHSNRSSVTEEELANRTKFYDLLSDSALIEVSENEDHHYECIKADSDPIYEEIEIPPPLPSNPPPSSLIDDLKLDKEFTTRSIFEGASKYDILSYLVDAKERGIIPEDSYTYNFGNTAATVEDSKENYNGTCHPSSVSDSSEDNSLIISGALIDEKAMFPKASEIERNDSGVGSETSKSSLSKYRSNKEPSMICEDCEAQLDLQADNEPLLCRKCVKRRSERKEIITEIVETEEKYSRDLQIILEEFYQPMLVAGLLTPDQLSAIFLNAEELLENSQALAERLRDAVEIAVEQGDEDLLTINIGKLFLEAAPMLHAFETYCVRQGSASLLLASLEKDKELLRIFLRVSQMENTLLRRMNLNSFLMVPVQRVTKYPLLLARLFKVSPVHHEAREQLKEAQHKIELHLNHMNSETKDVPSKLWRRIASSSGRRSSAEVDLVNIKLRKIAVDVLEWNHDEAKFALEGKLLFTQPTDNNWRKGRTIKLSPVNALLVINGKPSLSRTERSDENGLVFSRHSAIREAALLLVRDKNGRYSLLRDPLYLDRCVIAADPAWQSYFEVQELLGKDTFIFKAEDEDQTKIWYQQLQFHAQGMGAWRKRRNALANIMINGMGLRS